MSDMPRTRQSLLIELGRHSDAAWTEFLLVYEGAILGMCRARGLQDADARDVTQEVLAAVHRRIPTWDLEASTGSFRGWLLAVARNLAVDSISDRGRRELSADSEVERALSELPERVEEAQTAFDLQYQRSLFEWASERVKGEVREVTWRSFFSTAIEGRGAAEVADELGISVGSVYTAKCRVVARIRAKVASLNPEQPFDTDRKTP